MNVIAERDLLTRLRRGGSPAFPASVQSLGAICALLHVGHAS